MGDIVGAEAVKIWDIGYWATLILATVISFCLAEPRYSYDDEGEKGLEDFNGGLGHYSVWDGLCPCLFPSKKRNCSTRISTRGQRCGGSLDGLVARTYGNM